MTSNPVAVPSQLNLSKTQKAAFAKLPSKSAQIRYLTALSDPTWTRRQIADKVGVIYQFVYNVQNQKTK